MFVVAIIDTLQTLMESPVVVGVLKTFWKIQSRVGVFELATYSSNQFQTFLTSISKHFGFKTNPKP